MEQVKEGLSTDSTQQLTVAQLPVRLSTKFSRHVSSTRSHRCQLPCVWFLANCQVANSTSTITSTARSGHAQRRQLQDPQSRLRIRLRHQLAKAPFVSPLSASTLFLELLWLLLLLTMDANLGSEEFRLTPMPPSKQPPFCQVPRHLQLTTVAFTKSRWSQELMSRLLKQSESLWDASILSRNFGLVLVLPLLLTRARFKLKLVQFSFTGK